MKKILTAFAAAILLAGCTSVYDDSALTERVSSLETRVTALENSIAALQSAIGDGKFVQKVEEYVDPDTGKTVGVTVTYTTGDVKYFKIQPAIDYTMPVLSVIQNGAGDLCWAVDGVIVQIDGVDVTVYQTPYFTIDEEGNISVTVGGKTTVIGVVKNDGGATLQDGIFTNLAVEQDKVVLTLADGTTVNIPFAEAFKLNIATTEYEYNSLDPINIPYTVSAKTSGTVVAVSGYNPKEFKVEVTDAAIVVTPLKLTGSAVLLAYADSKVGLTSCVNIVIEAEEVEVGPVNLGKKATANSYIVTAAGDYKFPVVKGNTSDSVGEVAKAELLWETVNTEAAPEVNSVIASVSYADGFVTFSTPATLVPGNAVIVVKDASDAVLWNWLIWIPKTEIALVSDAALYGADVMDRNLGALDAATAASATLETYGLYYQWGRINPFPGKAATTGSFENASGPVSTDVALATPTTYYKVSESDSAGNWNSEDLAYLWETEEGAKGVYDPCPPGYKVPKFDTSTGLWIKGNDGWTYNFDANNYAYGNAVFPMAGWCSGGYSLSYEGARSIIFSATAHSNPRVNLKIIRKDKSGYYYANYFKVEAASVRCVVE